MAGYTAQFDSLAQPVVVSVGELVVEAADRALKLSIIQINNYPRANE